MKLTSGCFEQRLQQILGSAKTETATNETPPERGFGAFPLELSQR